MNPMIPLYVLVGLLSLAIPLRTYQLMFITDSNTGFYKTENWSIYAMYALAALAIIVPYIVVKLAKNVPSSQIPPIRKNGFMAVSSILFGLGIVFDVLSSALELFLNKDNASAQTAMGKENALPLLLEMGFGIFAAIYILIFGISYIDGKTKYSQYKFMALAPLGWTIGRVILRFLRKIAYVNIADLILELFALAFMMIFLLSLARVSSGLANEKSMRSIFASGYVCVFFCAVANVPRVVLMLIGKSQMLPNEYPLQLCDLFFALFAVAYIVNSMKYAKENDHAELE